jgi:hypothetical protein
MRDYEIYECGDIKWGGSPYGDKDPTYKLIIVLWSDEELGFEEYEVSVNGVYRNASKWYDNFKSVKGHEETTDYLASYL